MTQRAVWLDHGKIMADGDTASILLAYGRAMERRDQPADHQQGSARARAGKLMKTRGMNRWGIGGARVGEVHVGETPEAGGELDVWIAFEVSQVERAIFCVGFVDESGREVGAAASPTLSVSNPGGKVRCTIRPLPLRSGVYFPLVAILSEDGLVRDRWQLDRAVVIDRNGDASLPDGFGPIDIRAAWSGAPAEGQ
jgi:hypothetical protein